MLFINRNLARYRAIFHFRKGELSWDIEVMLHMR
jgi:hypothetical protein